MWSCLCVRVCTNMYVYVRVCAELFSVASGAGQQLAVEKFD